MAAMVCSAPAVCMPTDFQRSALLVGLKEEQQIGLNPVKLGYIAATDTHSANPGGC